MVRILDLKRSKQEFPKGSIFYLQCISDLPELRNNTIATADDHVVLAVDDNAERATE